MVLFSVFYCRPENIDNMKKSYYYYHSMSINIQIIFFCISNYFTIWVFVWNTKGNIVIIFRTELLRLSSGFFLGDIGNSTPTIVVYS
jgi:hypothetical protein